MRFLASNREDEYSMYPQFYGYDNPYPMFNQPALFIQQCYGMMPNMQMMPGKFVVTLRQC